MTGNRHRRATSLFYRALIAIAWAAIITDPASAYESLVDEA